MGIVSSQNVVNDGSDENQEKLDLISPSSIEQENISSSYSRSCDICCSPSPSLRGVFTGCGHSLCRACAAQLELAGGPSFMNNYRIPSCPFCRKQSTIVTLVESLIGERGSTMATLTSLSHSKNSSEKRKDLIHKLLDSEIDWPTYYTFYYMGLAEEACARGIKGENPDVVYVEEILRLELLPSTVARENLAGWAAFVQWKREKKELISRLRAEDEESSPLRYSRECPLCLSPSPSLRSLFTLCGHSICRDCAETRKSLSLCPQCSKKSSLLPLFD